jgi:hypothetical protein
LAPQLVRKRDHHEHDQPGKKPSLDPRHPVTIMSAIIAADVIETAVKPQAR